MCCAMHSVFETVSEEDMVNLTYPKHFNNNNKKKEHFKPVHSTVHLKKVSGVHMALN